MTERLRLVSNRADNTTAIVNLCVDADFADQFELRSDGRHYNKHGARRTARVEGDGVTFGYARGDWLSRTTVTTAPAPAAAAPSAQRARPTDWSGSCPSPRTERRNCC